MSPHSLSRRRFTAAALLSPFAVSALTSCGDNGAPEDGAAGSVDNSSIVLQTVVGLQPQYKKYADAYTAAFSTRKVEVRATTDDGAQYAQQLATARLSGELPDVFFNVDYLANVLAKNNVALDLAPGIAGGKLGALRIEDFLPQFVGQYRPFATPDQVTGLPVSADSVALFWNKDLFEAAGVSDYPRADWTWDEMYAAAEQIQSKSKNVTGLAAPLGDGSAQIIYGPVIKAFGGSVYDADTNKSGIGQPPAIEAWTMLINAYGKASNKYTATADDPSLDFKSGKVAMAVGSRAGIPAVKGALKADWDCQVLPTINGNGTAGGGSYGMSISQTSKNTDAAWAFLAWFYDPAGGMKVAQEVGGTIPPTNDGIDNGIWKNGTPPPKSIAIFGESARSAVLLAQLPGNASTAMATATKKATQEVVLKGRAIGEAFADAEKSVNKALESS